jgi:hypothetical protein
VIGDNVMGDNLADGGFFRQTFLSLSVGENTVWLEIEN